jgi:hypothetical protein
MEETSAVKPVGTLIAVCKCGRKVRVNEKSGKPLKHRVGKKHPGFECAKRKVRKETWCPEGEQE